MNILINGQAADSLSILDRGLQYGDGLFETMAVIDGVCPFWDAHLQRLQQGCQRLQLPVPDSSLLQTEAHALIQHENRAVLKLILSRGEGGRGYAYPDRVQPRRIFMHHPWPDYPQQNWREGVQVRFCSTTLARQPALAGLKHLNRLEQVLARNEWQDAQIAEGLMLEENGGVVAKNVIARNVIEGTMSNVFMVQDDILYTPDLSACGVAGIMRDTVLELARKADMTVCITNITKDQLCEADEIFLTNSLIGIWPVNRLEGQTFAVGDISRRLQMLLNREYPRIYV